MLLMRPNDHAIIDAPKRWRIEDMVRDGYKIPNNRDIDRAERAGRLLAPKPKYRRKECFS